MTQVGEGREAGYRAGAPAGGELLAERYQLAEHVNTDSAGRQIWQGVDVVLRRPVALVIRHPGGEAAAQMLQTAVAASRIVHPNLVGVYDAIDEQVRAYVVREWVDGFSLRDQVTGGQLDSHWALAVGQACADAIAAVHAAGISHGNVHPGTVLIDADGRVVLADTHADGTAPYEEDVRAIGGLLYFSLTGYWPHTEVAGPASLPDAVRDSTGNLAAPRQVRAGVPDHVDNLIMDLLDRRLPVPGADVLATELGRLTGAGQPAYQQPSYDDLRYDQPGYDPAAGYPAGSGQESGYPSSPGPVTGTGPIRFSSSDEPTGRPSGRRLVLGLSGLLVAALIGVLVGVTWLTGSPDPGGAPADALPSDPAVPSNSPAEPQTTPTPIALTASQLRVVDPPNGDRTELDGIAAVLDDDLDTGWASDTYNTAGFGNIKPGMGILIDLGEVRQVASVRVELATPGAVGQLRVGDSDPGSSAAGDDQIYQSYQPLGEPQQGGTTMVFNVGSDTTYQYLMVWFTDLPPVDGGFRVEVQQVIVEGY